jgi:group I intron endonuclease
MIGIYALRWEDEDLTYIGQSKDIERRFDEHMHSMLKGKHSNIRVQEAYNKYGPPIFAILEECPIENLNTSELYWFKEFNAKLNIAYPGNYNILPWEHANAKYSKLQILLVFRYLSLSRFHSTDEISQLTGVLKDSIISILSGKSHLWLKETYPYVYNRMLSIRHIRNVEASIKGKLVHSVILISPEGKEVPVNNITAFAKANNLDQACLSKVVNKDRKTHKGWKLKTFN